MLAVIQPGSGQKWLFEVDALHMEAPVDEDESEDIGDDDDDDDDDEEEEVCVEWIQSGWRE